MVKFNKYHVTDGTNKARCFYSIDGRTDGRKAVTIYARDCGSKIEEIVGGGEYKNETDSFTDYFDRGKVVIFEGQPLYAAALKRAESF